MLDTLVQLQPRSLKELSGYLTRLVSGRLWLKVLIGMLLGLATGILLGPSVNIVSRETAITAGNWLALPGQLFLVLIQMIVVPLVFASVILGLCATENVEQLRRLGIWVVSFFVITTGIAIIIGVNLALLIKPGAYIDSQLLHATLGTVSAPTGEGAGMPGLSDLPGKLINLFPSNPLNSMVESQMLHDHCPRSHVAGANSGVWPDHATDIQDWIQCLAGNGRVCGNGITGAGRHAGFLPHSITGDGNLQATGFP